MSALTMATIISVCVGALVGWFASSAATNIDARAFLTMIIGAVGAIVPGAVLQLVGVAAWSVAGLVVPAIGATGLLLVSKPWRWSSRRLVHG